MPLPPLLALMALSGEDKTPPVPVPAPRFELAAPLATAPGVMVDTFTTGYGLAQETAKAKGLQGRMIWIDATANLDRYNTEDKIVALVKQIADVGFNTIVFDVKPISGQVVYKSRLAPKLTEWRGKTMDAGFDPLPIMVREAHKDGLTLFASLNAFSEGHRLFNVGPGYARPTLQTVLYEPKPILRAGEASVPLAPGVDKIPPLVSTPGPNPNPTGIGTPPFAPVPPVITGGGVGVVTSLNALVPYGGFYAVVRKDGTVLEAAAVPLPAPPTTPASAPSAPLSAPAVPGKASVAPQTPAIPATTKPVVPVPTIAVPKGGAIVAGLGDGATWLSTNAHVAGKLVFDTEAEYVPIRERPEQQYPLMMNPLHPQVQQYALEIVREVVTNYGIDGILYDDRLRYGGMNADFSESTRAKFEEKMGKRLTWPDDVFKWTLTPGMTRGLRPGPYYDQWMAFRATAIQDFVRTVRYAIKGIRPAALFGVYAGSWYGDYPANGHNYASPNVDAGFWFLSPSYQKAGTAPLLDLLVAGCYYPTATIHEAFERGQSIGATVEASGTLVNRLVRDDTWAYAGIALSDFKDDPLGLTNALQAALASTQGVMVFDLSHDIEPMWPVFARAFAQRREAPHAHMDVLAEIKRRRESLDRLGRKDPPIVISVGSAGTGQ